MDIKAFRIRIEEEIRQLTRESAGAKHQRDPVELDQQSVGRLSRMDALQVQAMAQETERRRQARILALNAALKRIEDDEYGYCAACGEEIAEARLNLDPACATCIDCAATAVKS